MDVRRRLQPVTLASPRQPPSDWELADGKLLEFAGLPAAFVTFSQPTEALKRALVGLYERRVELDTAVALLERTTHHLALNRHDPSVRPPADLAALIEGVTRAQAELTEHHRRLETLITQDVAAGEERQNRLLVVWRVAYTQKKRGDDACSRATTAILEGSEHTHTLLEDPRRWFERHVFVGAPYGSGERWSQRVWNTSSPYIDVKWAPSGHDVDQLLGRLGWPSWLRAAPVALFDLLTAGTTVEFQNLGLVVGPDGRRTIAIRGLRVNVPVLLRPTLTSIPLFPTLDFTIRLDAIAQSIAHLLHIQIPHIPPAIWDTPAGRARIGLRVFSALAAGWIFSYANPGVIHITLDPKSRFRLPVLGQGVRVAGVRPPHGQRFFTHAPILQALVKGGITATHVGPDGKEEGAFAFIQSVLNLGFGAASVWGIPLNMGIPLVQFAGGLDYIFGEYNGNRIVNSSSYAGLQAGMKAILWQRLEPYRPMVEVTRWLLHRRLNRAIGKRDAASAQHDQEALDRIEARERLLRRFMSDALGRRASHLLSEMRSLAVGGADRGGWPGRFDAVTRRRWRRERAWRRHLAELRSIAPDLRTVEQEVGLARPWGLSFLRDTPDPAYDAQTLEKVRQSGELEHVHTRMRRALLDMEIVLSDARGRAHRKRPLGRLNTRFLRVQNRVGAVAAEMAGGHALLGLKPPADVPALIMMPPPLPMDENTINYARTLCVQARRAVRYPDPLTPPSPADPPSPSILGLEAIRVDVLAHRDIGVLTGHVDRILIAMEKTVARASRRLRTQRSWSRPARRWARLVLEGEAVSSELHGAYHRLNEDRPRTLPHFPAALPFTLNDLRDLNRDIVKVRRQLTNWAYRNLLTLINRQTSQVEHDYDHLLGAITALEQARLRLANSGGRRPQIRLHGLGPAIDTEIELVEAREAVVQAMMRSIEERARVNAKALRLKDLVACTTQEQARSVPVARAADAYALARDAFYRAEALEKELAPTVPAAVREEIEREALRRAAVPAPDQGGHIPHRPNPPAGPGLRVAPTATPAWPPAATVPTQPVLRQNASTSPSGPPQPPRPPGPRGYGIGPRTRLIRDRNPQSPSPHL